jgi:hypothetical protein
MCLSKCYNNIVKEGWCCVLQLESKNKQPEILREGKKVHAKADVQI